MRLAVTGAGGFVGRALAARLTHTGHAGHTLLIDRKPFAIDGFECVTADLGADATALALFDDVEAVCHLAALPGAAAQADTLASRRINCDLSLALIERLAGKRLVLASSIAVYGDRFGGAVDDSTPPDPRSIYATHKRMAELGFADAVRRGTLTGVALRLPGVVARPPAAAAFGSAFLSDIFHAIREGRAYTLPVGPDATGWMISASACARQLEHALLGDFTHGEGLLLPATLARMSELVDEIARHGDASAIRFEEKEAARRMFGSYPPLSTPRALALRFAAPETLPQLVEAALGHD